MILASNSRENRGLQHDVCGGLLTPIMFDWSDPECVTYAYIFIIPHGSYIRVRAGIRGSKEGFNISTNFYLTCLYPRDQFDVKRVEKNFLRSKLLVKVNDNILFVAIILNISRYIAVSSLHLPLPST